MLIGALNGDGGGSGNIVFDEELVANTSSFTPLELGFVPKNVIFYSKTGNSTNAIVIIKFDVSNNSAYAMMDSNAHDTSYDTWKNVYFKVEGTQFMFKAPNSAWANIYVFAE